MTEQQHALNCIWRPVTHAGPCMSRRDFDCCAYRSKSGKTGCGALRYYHDELRVKKRHAFVEPEQSHTKVYVLFQTDRADNEARIQAVTSKKEIAERWATLEGCHFDEFPLDGDHWIFNNMAVAA